MSNAEGTSNEGSGWTAPQGKEEPEASEATTKPAAHAAAGWFADSGRPGYERYWDGSTWTDQRRPAASGSPASGVSTERKTSDERRAMLAQQLQLAAAQGARVESQSEFQAVVLKGKPVNHVLHLLITLFTCGLWVIVWIAMAVTGGEKREMVVVDEFGNVVHQRLGKS